MTVVSARPARSASAPATVFERVLLRTAAAIDAYVAARLERRSTPEARRAIYARSEAAVAREAAQARGAIGILPR